METPHFISSIVCSSCKNFLSALSFVAVISYFCPPDYSTSVYMTLRTYLPHYKALLNLGFPIIIGQLGMIVVGFADTMMVGHYGTKELAASSFVNNMFNLVIIFSTGFSYGLTPIVGNLFGRKQQAAIGQTLKNALFTNGLMGLLLIFIMAILYLNIHRLGQPEELLSLMRPYYLILLVSLLFILLFNAFKQFSEGITDTKKPMFILLGGNLFNIIGNWLLIYGKCGFPEMGLLGAGISTLCSRILMLLCFCFLFFTAKNYRPYKENFIKSRINKADFLLLNKLGWPVGLQMGMETSSFSLCTIMIGWLGTTELAAHQVMLTIGQLGFMIYYGMAAAVAVRASNFHGQHDKVGISTSVKSGFHLIMFMAIIVSIALLFTRHTVGTLFTDNPEVVSFVATLIIPFIVYQFGDGLQCNYSNALRGISDVKLVTLFAFIAYFIISLPTAYLFGFICNWGLLGIWFSFPIGLTSAGLMFYFRFRSQIKE